MMRRIQLGALCAAALMSFAAQLSAGMITVTNGSYVSALAQHSTTNGVSVDSADLDIGTNTTLNVSTDNGAANTTTVSLLEVNGQTVLEVNADHQRSGLPYDAAITTLYFDFTATANTTFVASGFYNFVQPGAQAFIGLTLTDVTAVNPNPNDFNFLESNSDTLVANVQLGGMTSDFFIADGSLSGSLIAGRQYVLSGQMGIQALSGLDNDNGATADGQFRFVIGDANTTPPNAVPEPSSMLLYGIGSLALSIGTIRRRRRTLQNSSEEIIE